MSVKAILKSGLLLVVLGLWPSLRAAGAPADIEFPERETIKEIPPAVFPHWFHRVRFRCAVCHTAIFPMEVTGPEITMDEISAGRYCGACHNSDTAWSITFDKCPVCHVQR